MKISVVVPCYNSSETIRRCIESVFEQTLSPYEIIVVDDGSSDDTLLLLEKLKEECPSNIKYHILKQVNSGPSIARNKGIRHASGDWIAFLDSDDYWNEQNLMNVEIFLNINTKYSLIGGSLNNLTQMQNISYNALLYRNYFQTSTVIVKRNIINDFLFNERQKYSEDYRTWLLITYENSACIIPTIKAYPVFESNNGFLGVGLSSQLWMMEVGELSNYSFLRKNRKISFNKWLEISVWSYIKYLRRIFVRNFLKISNVK